MTASQEPPTETSTRRQDRIAFWKTTIVGSCVLAFLTLIFLFSASFEYGNLENRPIVTVTLLFIAAALLSLLAVRFALKINRSRRSLIWMILIFAASFRLMMIFSSPILEVDLYRYMWDGKVTNAGVSPFEFSPAQISARNVDVKNTEYQTVVALAAKTATLDTILSRIHFKEFTTIYPPVSQAVFSLSMWLIPDEASVDAHVYWMKTVLVLFDFATVLLILFLLIKCRIHPAWLIVYAWNPLVIKEIANSGHLDSIAVFWMVLSVCFVLSLLLPSSRKPGFGLAPNILGAVSLALGTGSKIFPVILLPAILFALMKHRSWQTALMFALIYVPVTLAVMWPMARENPEFKRIVSQFASQKTALNFYDGSIEPGKRTSPSTKPDAPSTLPPQSDGLTSFLKSWRMNDLVFSFIYYNAEPDNDSPVDKAWFVFVPNESRIAWFNWIKQSTSSENPAFFTSRIITLGCFAIAYIFILFKIRRSDSSADLLECFFLVIAMFFMFQPTQNPWYWLWAAPLVMFARNVGWLSVSVLLFVYYLRFWFESLEGEYWVGSFCYTGTGLFDYFGIFLEYGVILGAIFWFHLRMKPRSTNSVNTAG